MKKIFFSIAGFILFLALGPGVQSMEYSDPLDGVDYRELRLYHFLKEKDSPLKVHSEDFIQAADKWDIDWRLLPAITGLESAYGTRLVPDTYNGYGWAGGYFEFENWEHSIFYVSRKLSVNYYQNGLNDPYKIGPVYAPPNNRWGGLIASIMTQI